MNKLKINQDLIDKLNNIYGAHTSEPSNIVLRSKTNIPIAPPLNSISKTEIVQTISDIPIVPLLTSTPKTDIQSTSTLLNNNGASIDTNKTPISVSNVSTAEDYLMKFIISEHIQNYLELKEFKKKAEKELEILKKINQ